MAIGRIGSSGWTTHNGCASNQTGLAIQRTERSGGQHAISIYGNKQRTLLLCQEFNPDLVRNSTELVFSLDRESDCHHRSLLDHVCLSFAKGWCGPSILEICPPRKSLLSRRQSILEPENCLRRQK